MSVLTIQIEGETVEWLWNSIAIDDAADYASTFKFRVRDLSGTAIYIHRQEVLATDSVRGVIFSGYIKTAEPTNLYPDVANVWDIACVDHMDLPDRRLNEINYENYAAGDIVTALHKSILADEGIIATYATGATRTQEEFARGTLTNVVAAMSTGDGNLELLGSSSLGDTYNTAAKWNTGSKSNVTVHAAGDVSLTGVTRTWDDGIKSGQTLFGTGNPRDDTSGGKYDLICDAQSHADSRLDFAGMWQNGTFEVDIYLWGDIPKRSLEWRTTSYGDADNGYAYVMEMTSLAIEIRRGSNSGDGGSSTSLASTSLDPKLGYGWYRGKLVVNGSSFSFYLNNTLYLSTSDGTYSAAAYFALRNRNPEPSTTVTAPFDNLGIMAALSGTWTSPSQSLSSITTIASSVISWDPSGSSGSGWSVLVQTSINNGSSYQTCSNGGAIPGLPPGTAGSGKTLIIRVTLSTSKTDAMPDIKNLQWAVVGGYVASGTRTDVPYGNDTMERADVVGGWGPAFDGQTYTKNGTGTPNLTAYEATIANTTGDCDMKYGSTSTATDLEGTDHFAVSAGGTSSIMKLRYQDANNYYGLAATVNSLIIQKKSGGASDTLKTASPTLSAATFYHRRFRVTGSDPVLLQGKIWALDASEPDAWTIEVTD